MSKARNETECVPGCGFTLNKINTIASDEALYLNVVIHFSPQKKRPLPDSMYLPQNSEEVSLDSL